MKMFVEPWQGTLRYHDGDKDARPGTYLRASVPNDWIEMKALDGHSPAWVSVPLPNSATFGFAPFVEKAFIETFGPGLTPMDFWASEQDHNRRGRNACVVASTAIGEWLAEMQGYTHTLRFTRMIDAVHFRREIEKEIDDDVVVIPHIAHFALKARDPHTITLLDVKYGEYRTQFDTHSSLSEMLPTFSRS
jgi:hypothetical protein